jgi:hypothetical protein
MLVICRRDRCGLTRSNGSADRVAVKGQRNLDDRAE